MVDTVPNIVNIQKIFDLLPHRYPFLLVDRVLQFKVNESIEAIKNVTVNEPFFQGHFSGFPVMPGMLILEALAQTGGILLGLSGQDGFENKLYMFTGVKKARFRRPVVPGDQLLLRCYDIKCKFKLVRFTCEALVAGEIVAEAILSAAAVRRNEV
ncbi:3-hydroxy-acyl-(acyl-carrier-protein) dehydratase [Desulfovibrionales bacterium]